MLNWVNLHSDTPQLTYALTARWSSNGNKEEKLTTEYGLYKTPVRCWSCQPMLTSGLLYRHHCFYHITTCEIMVSRGSASFTAPVLPGCNGTAERVCALGNTLKVADDFSLRHSGASTHVFLATTLHNVVVFVGLYISLYYRVWVTEYGWH